MDASHSHFLLVSQWALRNLETAMLPGYGQTILPSGLCGVLPLVSGHPCVERLPLELGKKGVLFPHTHRQVLGRRSGEAGKGGIGGRPQVVCVLGRGRLIPVTHPTCGNCNVGYVLCPVFLAL